MTLGAKILSSLAALCFLAWGIALALGVQPLVPARDIDVIYAEHEEFRDDGMAFRKLRNRTRVLLYLPQAGPGRQWWTVDFGNNSIADSSPPRSFGGWRYVLQGDLGGTAISGYGSAGTWLWHFSDDSAAFAGRSFTCVVRKAAGNERAPGGTP